MFRKFTGNITRDFMRSTSINALTGCGATTFIGGIAANNHFTEKNEALKHKVDSKPDLTILDVAQLVSAQNNSDKAERTMQTGVTLSCMGTVLSIPFRTPAALLVGLGLFNAAKGCDYYQHANKLLAGVIKTSNPEKGVTPTF